jgi:hypothetical protein
MWDVIIVHDFVKDESLFSLFGKRTNIRKHPGETIGGRL